MLRHLDLLLRVIIISELLLKTTATNENKITQERRDD